MANERACAVALIRSWADEIERVALEVGDMHGLGLAGVLEIIAEEIAEGAHLPLASTKGTN